MSARSLVVLVILGASRVAAAHSYEPSLLEVDQRDAQHVVLRFFPARTLAPTTPPPTVQGCVTTNLVDGSIAATCATGALAIVLPPGDGEVLVMFQRLDAERLPLTSSLGDTVHLALTSPPAPSVVAAVRLGVVHIATGFDHLLFVAALVALFGLRRRLLWLVTGFSLGHSVTLALGAYGVLLMPPLFVEALIALSLVLLARELVRRDETSLLRRRPLLVASAFGLVHGCGFAAALGELGVRGSARLPVLFGFNLGVELGQLAFVALLAAGVVLLRRFAALAALAKPTTAYTVGAVGVALLIERVSLW